MTGSEFALINWIKSLKSARMRAGVGIGDDAAVIPGGGTDDLLIATDILLDGVHFDCETTTLPRIGRKALAVNLSDIAAMGGTAETAFISLALPNHWSQAEVQQLYLGIDALAQQFSIEIAGGDTTAWDGRFAINVVVTGRVPCGTALLRSGARPGDRILVTGPLGLSLRGSHLDFTPRLAEIAAIRDRVKPHAAIDISDGLAADLHHVLLASQVDAVLKADQIPLRHFAEGSAAAAQLENALSDGEDFELLLCLAEPDAIQLMQQPITGVQLFEIGTITSMVGEGQPECRLQFASGREEPLPPRGWVHQFGK